MSTVKQKYAVDENGEIFSPITSVSSVKTPQGGGICDLIYPIGSIYLSTSSTSPSTLFGGTWVQIEGRFLIGVGTATDINSDTRTLTNGQTGGEYAHKLTISEMPSHNHTGYMYNGWDDGNFTGNDNRPAGADAVSGATYTTNKTGGDSRHNNIPPYLAVYMWKRTA